MRTQRIRDRLESMVGRARARSRLIDHLARALAHYGSVLGSQLAAAATYFGFLSFFPLVALAFAVLGYVVVYVPEAERAATAALSSIFPGMIGTGPGKIDVQAIARRKADVGVLGLLVLLYSGLGWVSALRAALEPVFQVASVEKRNFLVGKLYDLLVLVVVGVVLLLSVGLGTVVTGFTGRVVRLFGLGGVPGAGLVLVVASVLVGIAVNALIFLLLYRLLPKHTVPTRVLWQGALFGGVGSEVLKQAAGLVIGMVTRNPLYGAFAIMVALLVWINYFNRLAVLGAAWAAVAATPTAESSRTAGSSLAAATASGAGRSSRGAGTPLRGTGAGPTASARSTEPQAKHRPGRARRLLAGAGALGGVVFMVWHAFRRRRNAGRRR